MPLFLRKSNEMFLLICSQSVLFFLQACEAHLPGGQEASSHYKAVCRALVNEAQELVTFLETISVERDVSTEVSVSLFANVGLFIEKVSNAQSLVICRVLNRRSRSDLMDDIDGSGVHWSFLGTCKISIDRRRLKTDCLVGGIVFVLSVHRRKTQLMKWDSQSGQ